MRLVLAALAATLCLVAAAPAHAAAHTCAEKGSKTVRKTADVRVFTVRVPDGTPRDLELYACLFANGRKQFLAESDPGDGIEYEAGFADVRAAGHYVAWDAYEFDLGCKADCPDNYDPTT